MKRLWFNANGILRDSLGLVVCDYCPCDEPPSSSGSSGSSGSSSSVTPDPCQDGCRVVLPTDPTGVIDYFDLVSTYYDPITGDWEVVMEVKQNGAYSTGVILNSGGSNAVITTHSPAANFPGGPTYTAGTIITVQGTSDPPGSGNCGSWQFSMQSFSIAYLPFTFSSEICEVEIDCCPGVKIPTELTATVTGGSCPGSFVMEWDGTAWRGGNGTLSVDLSCTGTPAGWYFQVDGDAQSPTVNSCDPLSVTHDFYSTLCGDITITVTG